jgi:hypothetical protein
MLHRATSTLSHLALIGLALLALGASTLVWLYEVSKAWIESRRAVPAYELTTAEPADTSELATQQVTVTESATSVGD